MRAGREGAGGDTLPTWIPGTVSQKLFEIADCT